MLKAVLKGPPYEIKIEGGDSTHRTVIVELARDDDDTRVVSVVSELIELVIGERVYWDFSFSIDVFALDDSIEPFSTQDRSIAAPYIPEEIRGAVMEVVAESLRGLIQDASPPFVYLVIKDPETPPKGMPKYHMLRDCLHDAGYVPADEGTDPFGRRFWVMGC